MKIAMIGSGATGSVFASYLRLGGADVWLVDPYKAHLDAAVERGMLFHRPDGDTLVTGFYAAPTADTIGTMDVVIILVNTTMTELAVKGALPAIGENTVVMSLQNGLGNVEKIAQFVPSERIMYGSGNIGTELPAPGECTAKTTAGVQLHFGAVKRTALTEAVGTELLALFTKGGCNANFDEDIRFFVWRKAVANISANALMGLLRLNAGYMFDNEHAYSLFLGILRECAAVADALGIDGGRIYELCKKPELGSMRDYYSSTAQDMLIYKRQTEIDSFNGAISAYGKKLGIDTPYNDFVTDMVKAIQENYENQYK